MSFFARLFGGRRSDTPAAQWIARRPKATPEEVIQQHFEAMVAHDLEWILATLTPERARLYGGPTTMDKRRQSVRVARVLGVEPVQERADSVPGYAEQQLWRVDYDLDLVSAEDRRDPSLSEGRQWAYYLLVRHGPRKPWLIADWGR